MPASDKPRLYIALYARGNSNDGEAFHWALVVGPKSETPNSRGARYHAKNPPGATQNWVYERRETSMMPTNMLLLRMVVAKVTDWARLEQVLAAVALVQNDSSWNCRLWVRDALAALEADGHSLGTKRVGWDDVEQQLRQYAQNKIAQHRFDGQADWDMSKVPTYDLLEGKEVTP